MHKRIDPFEFLYFIGYSIKKAYSLHKQKKLPCKVISVGNITTGGTGKTPTTIALAEEAKKRGFQPVILTRGYKGKAKEPVLVNFPQNKAQVQESNSNISPEMLGDEAFMMSERLKDVPLVKYSDRYNGGMLAFHILRHYYQSNKIVFILDDGFQHWSLYRDVDIALVDGIDPFGNRKMLPFGVLRELPRELRRADIILITKRKNEELKSRLRLINPKAPIFYSEYKIKGIKQSNGESISIDAISNKKIYAFCGLAQPESFKELLSSISIDTPFLLQFPDHYHYREKDIVSIKRKANKLRCDYIITTEKDIVKVKEYRGAEDILFVDIRLSVDQGFYETALA